MSDDGRYRPEGFSEAERLRAEVELTRAELAETVEALAAKADVKARAKESVEDAKARARESVANASAKAREAVGGATARAKQTVGGATLKARDSLTTTSSRLRGPAEQPTGYGVGPAPTGQELTLGGGARTARWLPVAVSAVVGGLIGLIVATLRRRRR